MNLSKRTLILTAVAILGIIAAVFSVYLEKRETEKDLDDLLKEPGEEIEPDPEPEPAEVFKPTKSKKPAAKIEPEPEIIDKYEAGEPAK